MASKSAKHKSELLQSVHETAQALNRIGVMSKSTMRDFDLDCLTTVADLAPDEIRGIRERANMSQATFALALNVTKYLVSKWERGEARPSGPSLKLLALADSKGVEAIL